MPYLVCWKKKPPSGPVNFFWASMFNILCIKKTLKLLTYFKSAVDSYDRLKNKDNGLSVKPRITPT